jgi:hypothetical protein
MRSFLYSLDLVLSLFLLLKQKENLSFSPSFVFIRFIFSLLLFIFEKNGEINGKEFPSSFFPSFFLNLEKKNGKMEMEYQVM